MGRFQQANFDYSLALVVKGPTIAKTDPCTYDVPPGKVNVPFELVITNLHGDRTAPVPIVDIGGMPATAPKDALIRNGSGACALSFGGFDQRSLAPSESRSYYGAFPRVSEDQVAKLSLTITALRIGTGATDGVITHFHVPLSKPSATRTECHTSVNGAQPASCSKP